MAQHDTDSLATQKYDEETSSEGKKLPGTWEKIPAHLTAVFQGDEDGQYRKSTWQKDTVPPNPTLPHN